MGKLRFDRVTGFACIGLLLLAACGREGEDEMSWARAALERNKALEVVAADQQTRTFTVRLTESGELRTVRADAVWHLPRGRASSPPRPRERPQNRPWRRRTRRPAGSRQLPPQRRSRVRSPS
jgi:hypothetical protein